MYALSVLSASQIQVNVVAVNDCFHNKTYLFNSNRLPTSLRQMYTCVVMMMDGVKYKMTVNR